VGTTTVTVTANDGNGGTVSDTFDIVISNTNDAPTVANLIPDQVATEDSAFTFTFAANTFNDVDGDTLTYTSDASGWLSFDAATRTFSGTPLNADVGTTTVTVTANDGNGGTVSDTFDIVISNTNDAPTVANAIADQVATEDSAFTFTFAANTFNDIDGDTLSYTSDASGWLSFDAATRTFSGTPLNADVGTTTVTVTANDGNGGTVSDTFDIVIGNTNDAPTVANAIADQVAIEDSAFSFTFAANTFDDVDGDTLTYTSDASGWLSFDAATRTFSGTPLNADVGTTTVTVTANDGNGGTVSDTFDIVISNTNDAPTVANLIPDQVATEDSAFTFTFAANTFNDIDGDTLTYTSDASGWLSFDAATRTFSGTPLNADVGTTTVTVTANDGNGGTVSDTFDIVISNTNDAPTATNLNAPETYTEDTALNLTNIVVTDVDSTIVTVRLTLSDIAAGSLNTGTSGSVTSTFSSGVWTASGAIVDVNALLAGLTFTPALNYSSNFTIATSVEDDGVVAPTTGIKVMTVIADNDAPTVANLIPDQVATEDSVFSVTFAANTFNDVDGDTLTYTSDASGWLSFDAATRTFSGTPLNGDVGTTTVTVTANDGNGGTVSDTFDIVIGNTNDAPTVANAIADQVATEDGVFSFTFAANTFNDVDGDTLSYTSNASGWLSFDAATRTFRGIPLNADVGTTTVTVTANDGKGGTVSDTFDIVINNTNDAAIIAGVDTGSLTEDLDPDADTLLEVSGALTITDVDTGEANFNAGVLTGSYGNLTIDAAGNWRYEADNTQAAIQNLPASATLTDTISVTSFDGTTHNIVITIGGVNDTPTALNDAPGAVDEGGTAIFDLATNDSDIDNALDLNSIVITAVPSNGSLIVNGDGTVTYSHDGSETVSDSFSYTIADVTGAISNAATVNVTVNPLNDAPSALDDIQTVAEGNSVNIDLAANDVDVDNSLVLNSIVIVGAPVNGTLIVNANGTVDYTHDGSQTLSDSFSYIISDISGAISNVATVNITVIPVNDAPTTIGITDVSVTEDSTATSIDLNAAFDDVDNLDSELTYSITGNTSIGLFTTTAVNAVTGELVLDYSADMNGTSQISIRATDPLGAFVDTLFTVTVTPVNDAPVLVANTGMTAVGTSSAVISNTELSVDDIDNTDTSIVYIVTALPTSGVLMLDGVPVTINSSFTEDDVVNNRLSYQADATGTNDQFAFTVSDSAGGMITANTFNIVVQIVPPVPETPDPEITPVPVVTTTTFDPVDATQPGLGISELEASPTQEIEDWYAGGVTTTRPQPGLTLEPVQHIVLEQAVQDNVRIFENDEVPAESNKLADYSLHTVTSYADMQVRSIKALWVAIDQMKQQIDDNVTEDITQVEFRAAAVSSSGVALTAGIVAWALRSGALMTSLISTIPLWKGYDPLPILTYRDDDDENKSNLTEEKIPTSLEELKKVKALREKMEKYNQVDSMFDNNRAVE
jgi:VCBS repeat-containing protein